MSKPLFSLFRYCSTDFIFQAELKAQNSPIFTNNTGIAGQLASFLDVSFNVLSVSNDPNQQSNSPNINSDASNNNGPSSSHQAIIGVCAAFGALAALVGAWWIYRTIQRKREQGHHRLSLGSDRQQNGYGGTAHGGGYNAQQQAVQPSMEERRRSFFFAEDELRGYAGERSEEDAYVRNISPTQRRSPINTAAISQPILRESSLNW
jgi:hypothetical protein